MLPPTQPSSDFSNRIATLLTKHAPPAGLSVLVASATTSHSFAAGYSDILNSTRLDPSHAFGIGSITKIFVAVVILQLIEEGKLHLSDRVDNYLPPEITHDIENAASATIEQLLGHTAGIDSWEDDPEWIVHGRGRLVRPEHIWTKTKPLEFLRRPRKIAPDRGKWYYANTNYTLLGLVIEAVTHASAEAEIRRRILEPLKMENTYLDGFEAPPPAYSNGTASLPSRYHVANASFRDVAGRCPHFTEIDKDLIEVKDYNMSTSWLAGGMVSTPSDLIKFALALRDGKLLRPESIKFIQQWRPTGAQGLECGHGLFRMELPGSGKWMGHSGGVLGFSSGLWWHEERNCVLCVLGNVGTVHTGGAVGSVKALLTDEEFSGLALDLVG